MMYNHHIFLVVIDESGLLLFSFYHQTATFLCVDGTGSYTLSELVCESVVRTLHSLIRHERYVKGF